MQIPFKNFLKKRTINLGYDFSQLVVTLPYYSDRHQNNPHEPVSLKKIAARAVTRSSKVTHPERVLKLSRLKTPRTFAAFREHPLIKMLQQIHAEKRMVYVEPLSQDTQRVEARYDGALLATNLLARPDSGSLQIDEQGLHQHNFNRRKDITEGFSVGLLWNRLVHKAEWLSERPTAEAVLTQKRQEAFTQWTEEALMRCGQAISERYTEYPSGRIRSLAEEVIAQNSTIVDGKSLIDFARSGEYIAASEALNSYLASYKKQTALFQKTQATKRRKR